jgi:hypothetical protein
MQSLVALGCTTSVFHTLLRLLYIECFSGLAASLALPDPQCLRIALQVCLRICLYFLCANMMVVLGTAAVAPSWRKCP